MYIHDYILWSTKWWGRLFSRNFFSFLLIVLLFNYITYVILCSSMLTVCYVRVFFAIFLQRQWKNIYTYRYIYVYIYIDTLNFTFHLTQTPPIQHGNWLWRISFTSRYSLRYTRKDKSGIWQTVHFVSGACVGSC